MSEVNYADFYKQMLVEAGQGAEVLPEGEYELRIAGKNVKPAGGNRKLQVGIRLEVTSGAYAGKSTWVNQTFTPENAKAVSAYLATMQQLGGEQVKVAMAAGESPEQLAGYIAVGTTGTATLTSTDGNRPDENGNVKKFQNVKNFKITGFVQTAALPTTPGGTVPGSIPSPGPLPTPQMPAMQAPGAPQQPVSIPQPQPMQPVGTVPQQF